MSAINVNKNNFEEIIKSEKKVLLDFYADWCGPCRMVLPLVEQIAQENPQYVIGKVNIDNEPELAQAFDVFSVPTLVVLEDGKVINQSSGARPKNQILALLEG
ncbi:MAG: thioredoxin [Clostridia bacterium]|nr:thioredoxin [Clostridia bacterium]